MANYAVRLIAPVLLGALILLFPADGLRALGLGEARVDSWLGQPLDVSIRLIELENEAVESVSVGPASLQDFERLGVPSQSLGLGLEVTVDRRARPPIVRVRSQRPVNDPIVQILIDARWSSGRVLREYTLFLDPPVMESAAPAREVSQPAEAEPIRQSAPAERETRPSREAAEPAAPPAAPPSRPDEEAPSAPATRGADTVAVAPGDTLWSIASDWRPDRNLSMDQVMLAIFNRNRDAFLGENINRMRSDTRLEMPALDEIRSVDRDQAEQRVREHMRTWQPAMGEDLPVVSDAAMPEPPGRAETVAETPPPQSEEDYRLDVVPPDEDQFSDSSAVAEADIERVSERLSDIEEEIAASELDNDAFDEHANEIRDALQQRDMAGLAVAEESLAELETRLREAREARAEEQQMAQAADGESATDSEDGDRIADYMRDLQEEFGMDDGADDPAGDEEMAMTDDAAAAGADDSSEAAGIDATDEQVQAIDEQVDEEPVADSQDIAAEAGGADEVVRPMTVTRTSSGGMSGWLWPVAGLLLLVILVAAGLWWLRRRRESAGPGGRSPFAGDAAASARAVVDRKPDDLAAHLALLKLLADQGRDQEFTDAFDQMYQHVDDEAAPEWQEALSLAAIHAPDHPLLTPHETSVDDDFDRRADEMLGMLDVDESDADSEFESGAELRSSSDESDEDEIFSFGEAEGVAAEDSEDSRVDTFDEDTDLAVLSERLDDPDTKPVGDELLDDEGDPDFDEFEELDEYSPGDEDHDETAVESDEHSEAPVDFEDDQAPEPDLDLEVAREQEADDVFGQTGTRGSEDLDLELSSDIEDFDSETADSGLDLSLEDTADSQGLAAGDEPEPVEEPEPQDPEASGEDEAPAATDASLSDEDADVKLDLARAYISVDLADSARTVLEEVISDGSQEKRDEAKKLLDSIV